MNKNKTINRLTEFFESLTSDAADIYLFFTDLVGSTEYKNNLISQGLPDIFWIQRQLIFLNRVAEIVRKYNGQNVKTIGDEVFSFFDATTNPLSILYCAIDIIQAFENLKTYTGISKIESKISIDFGPTYNGSIDGNINFDPIGLPVDRCARLNNLASRNEVLFSDAFLEILSSNKTEKELKNKYNFTSHSLNIKGLGTVEYHKFNAI